MWALRILNGPQAGQFYILKQGKNKLGRAATCDFVVTAAGVSKEHAEITVYPDKVIFVDLNSSNGTFLNGVRVKTGMIRMGDKLSVHQVLLDLIVVQENSQPSIQLEQQNQSVSPQVVSPVVSQPNAQPVSQPIAQPMPGPMAGAHPVAYPGYHPYPTGYPQGYPPGYQQAPGPIAAPAPPASVQPNLLIRLNDYINRVALPGVFRLSEVFEFKMIVIGFATVFILVVSLLSVIPMKQITSESIHVESRRRALTVARALAQANERIFRSGDLSSFSTDLVLREDGIDDVYIISKQGNILAPPEKVGLTPKEAGLLKRATGQDKNFAEESGGKIVAAIPILGYDPNLQLNVAKAYTVVVYNPGSLTFDDGRALGLFVQILAIAMVVGAFMFFLLYKLIEFPFIRLNQSLDVAMREGKDNANVDIKFPVVQNLLTNINSLLARALAGPSGDSGALGAGAKNHEYLNLLELVGYPGMLLTVDKKVMKVNSAFEALTGINPQNIEGRDLTYLPDQALQKNIFELTNVAAQNSSQISRDQLDFGGTGYQLNCQVFTTPQGDVDCYLVTISQSDQAAAGGAA